jgi:gamma-glutamylcyclotransferase (GGCT)/AIG2-like uncharacterized protein YtfP
MLYFAYGSNLNSSQMKSRCPESKKIDVSILHGYQLLFRSHDGKNSYLTIENIEQSTVPIGIYQITENDEKTLDCCEGVHSGSYRKEILEIELAGKKTKGLVYIMNDGKPLLPENKYYNKVLEGYRDFEFDKKYLIEAYDECTQRLLDKLLVKIENENFNNIIKGAKEWGGAGVIITHEDDNDKKKWRDNNPTHTLVKTEFSIELSWLFKELQKIFSERIDSMTKYGFFRLLATTAISYCSNNQKNINRNSMLSSIIEVAREMLDELPPLCNEYSGEE